MGLLDDIAAWIGYYIVHPALVNLLKEIKGIPAATALLLSMKLRAFFNWVMLLNTSVEAWVKNEIKKAIDSIEDGDWDFFGWINSIINAVFDAIENIFVRVVDLAGIIRDKILDWWEDARDAVLRTVKDTFLAIADFTATLLTELVRLGYETFSVIITTVGDMISVAVDVIAGTVANIAESVATAISDIIISITEAVAVVQDALTDLAVKIAEDIAETAGDLNKIIAASIDELFKLIEEKVPGWVESMFDWARGVPATLLNATGYLGQITDVFTGEAEEDPVITEAKDKIKEEQDAIEDIVEGLR